VGNYCNLVESSDLGLQSDRLHSTHSPDMISPFGSRGADCSATLPAGTETPLLRPLKLQQPNHQNASEYDVSCLSLTHMSGWWNRGQACGGKFTAWLQNMEKDEGTHGA
jgi:hypothetical protein